MLDFELYLQIHYDCTPDDLEVSDIKGYWRFKKPCDGKDGCNAMVHRFIKDPIFHTINYYDEWREKGKFVSPYRTWKKYKDAKEKNQNSRSSG